jgi:hypothetical protein
MNHTHHRVVRRVLPAAVAAGALGIVLGAGPTGAQTPAEPAEITMSLKGKDGLQFKGAKQVATGQELQIRNTTAPRRIGPHTFTLATSRVLPKTARQGRRCFSGRRVCLRTAIAHRFNERTGKVGRALVKAGKAGWDRSFSRNTKTKGDSWYTEKKGEKFSQVVSAPAGTTLRFLCVVHPEMQGSLKVV